MPMVRPGPDEGAAGPLGDELVAAARLAEAAGDAVLRIRRGDLGVEMKAGDEPVTVADRAASDLIVAGLRAAFPGDAVIPRRAPTTGRGRPRTGSGTSIRSTGPRTSSGARTASRS